MRYLPLKIAAIICEYNPFHNGHLHQLEYIRKNTDADRTIAIMSGDFVQRGEPAVFSKEARTRMALASGVDAVFLLPVAYSTAGAELFARGGVALASGLGADYLVFGSECGDVSLLQDAAIRLAKDGTADSERIRELMSEGHTFAKARALAFPEYSDLLSCPNNVLGIEYIIAGLSLNTKMTFVTHERIGASYNDDTMIPGSDIQSATALRMAMALGEMEGLSRYVPETSAGFFTEESRTENLLFPDEFSDILFARLSAMDEGSEYLEVSPSLLNRIRNLLGDYRGFDDFADRLKTRNLTRAGIMRGLCHIMLDIKASDLPYKDVSRISHVRLLGFRDESSDVLTQIKRTGTLETVSKVPDVLKELDTFNAALFEQDLRAATVCGYVRSRRSGKDPVPEYSKPVIRMP